MLTQRTVFIVPVVTSTFLWYNLIRGKELLYLFNHNDFRDWNFPDYTPTYTFASDFIVNYGLGLFFCVATTVSLAATLLFWRRLPKKMILFDAACLFTLVFIGGLVLYLAINLPQSPLHQRLQIPLSYLAPLQPIRRITGNQNHSSAQEYQTNHQTPMHSVDHRGHSRTSTLNNASNHRYSDCTKTDNNFISDFLGATQPRCRLLFPCSRPIAGR
ncbi:MAG: hypothetical protein LBI79_05860 [Nitrososphaerota archaeon]|nr:hypothetical protein [Nitrososphaerota archaeon]